MNRPITAIFKKTKFLYLVTSVFVLLEYANFARGEFMQFSLSTERLFLLATINIDV